LLGRETLLFDHGRFLIFSRKPLVPLGSGSRTVTGAQVARRGNLQQVSAESRLSEPATQRFVENCPERGPRRSGGKRVDIRG
jgi:hypothetical protein